MADQTKKNSIKRNDNLKKYIAVIFVCVTMLGMACGQKPDSGKEREELPQLIIGSDNYEPYNYLDDDGNPAGIDVELAEAVCDKLGYTPVFLRITWDKKDEYLDRSLQCRKTAGLQKYLIWKENELQFRRQRNRRRFCSKGVFRESRKQKGYTVCPVWMRSTQVSEKGMWMRLPDMRVH